MRAYAIGLLTLLLAGLSGPPPADAQTMLQCSGTRQAWMVAELLFGREHVSERRWWRFLAAEITPRFPDGLTVFDARGQWRAPGRSTIARERSKIVMIAMPPSPDNDKRLQDIVEAYKARFKQQSIGLIVRPACVSF